MYSAAKVKVSTRNTRAKCEMRSKLAVKTSSDIVLIFFSLSNVENSSHFELVVDFEHVFFAEYFSEYLLFLMKIANQFSARKIHGKHL